MKPPALCAALLLGISILIACRPDIDPPPVPPIVGSYDGWLIFDSLGSAGGVLDSQPCLWRFAEDSFTYERPSSIPESVPRVFCDCFGTWALTDGIVLTQDTGWVPSEVCDKRRNLIGKFVILDHSDSLLWLAQAGSNSVVKTARLIRTE